MKHFWWLTTVFILFISGSPADAAELTADMNDACNILLKGRYNLSCLLRSACPYSDGIIPNTDIAAIMAELRAIRTSAPEVAKVHEIGGFELRQMLVYDLSSLPLPVRSLEERIAAIHRLISSPLATGIREFDDLNRKFAVVKVDGDYGTDGDGLLVFHFNRPLDIMRVVPIYRRQLGNHFQPNFYYGGGDHIERLHDGDRPLQYVFSIGSGDCPADCIDYSSHQFALYPRVNGFRVEKVRESSRSHSGPLLPDSRNLRISATAATLGKVSGLALAPNGDVIFSSSQYNAVFRLSSSGFLTVVAGNGTRGFGGDNERATGAWLNDPQGLAVDASGNIFMADMGNNRVRKVSSGVITKVAGNGTEGFTGDNGPAVSAQLTSPIRVAVFGRTLYIADSRNFRVRKISNGIITTVAGNGTSGLFPDAIALDKAGELYVADYGNHRVLKVSGGALTTIAGNGHSGFSGDGGPASEAQLNSPNGIAVDTIGAVYTADSNNHRVRKVWKGVITTVVGNGVAGFGGDNGPPKSAQTPIDVAVDSAFNLYIVDASVNRIRKVSKGVITTIAGNGITSSR